MKKNNLFGLMAGFIVILVSACSTGHETARVRISLVDSPGDFDEADIDVQSVQLNSNPDATDSDNSWITVQNEAGPVNLLDYTNGEELTLSDTEFPTGKLSLIRLVLGSDNSIIVNGNKYDLANSMNQQGLTVRVDQILKEGNFYNFHIDFDLSRSILDLGNGRYILKPVLRLIGMSDSGLSGNVFPAQENVAILLLSGKDTVASSYAIAGTSGYKVLGIAAGAYSVIFDPGKNSKYESKTLNNVLLTSGEVNSIDSLELDLK